MNTRARFLLTIALLSALGVPSMAQGDRPSMRKADALFDRGRWEAAAEVYGAITAADPQNGQAWFRLAYCRHNLQEWAEASEANLQAARFPAFRATALYNLACSQSLGGQVSKASGSLKSAVEAGFLDFDLMATDADLEALRAQGLIDLPTPRVYREKKARGGIRMRYAIVEPQGYRADAEYPVLVAFAPGAGTRAADWMMETLWDSVGRQSEWIVVCLIAPKERGWFTHPSHHALEDLLKSLKKQYRVAGDSFHLFGYAEACAPALTYSNMSKAYFQSMTLVSCASWGTYDDSDMRRWKRMPVLQIVGEEAHTLEADQDAHERLLRKGVRASLTVVPGDGLLVGSMSGGDYLEAITEAHVDR